MEIASKAGSLLEMTLYIGPGKNRSVRVNLKFSEIYRKIRPAVDNILTTGMILSMVQEDQVIPRKEMI